MNKLNLFFPQWQGSGLTDELYYGALSLKEYVEIEKSIYFTEILTSTDPILKVEKDILGFREIESQLFKAHDVINQKQPKKIFTIGGGCGVEIPIVSYLSSIYKNMDILWFDAHGDLNCPKDSPSKHFHGMPLRFLLDSIEGNSISKKFNKINSKDVNLIGVRDLDKAEEDYIEERGIRVFNTSNLKKLIKSCRGENEYVYIHIDLDVIDPESYKNVKCPTKNGLKIAEVVDIIKSVNRNKKIVGLSILENTEVNYCGIKSINNIINLGVEF